MTMEARISDHVLCDRLGTGEFKVTSMDSRHYTVQPVGGGPKQVIYKALCHITFEMRRANHERRVERANKIGRPR